MTFASPFAGAVCRLTTALAANEFGFNPDALLTPMRQHRLARARHVAMYLTHVGLGVKLGDVARCFERDPATIRYACARIEDARDDHAFDQRLNDLEDQARSDASHLLCSGVLS